MMKCVVCESDVARKKRYDRHLVQFSGKMLINVLLPYFDVLIDKTEPIIKRFSTRKSNLFKGYVGICGTCGHGAMEHPPTNGELRKYYEGLYWSQWSNVVNTATTQNDNHRLNLRAIHQINFILENLDCEKITSILEIGAGAASASLLLRETSKNSLIKLYACEPGQQWESFYHRHGIEKVADYFPFKTQKRFDYVHTSHWLEHVLDLDVTLSALNNILNPSGHLFVEVPNTEHFYWDLPQIDTPHIHFFTRESLIKAFDKHGFKCLKVGEYGITFLERKKGVSVPPERYGPCEKGFWIRALFKRSG